MKKKLAVLTVALAFGVAVPSFAQDDPELDQPTAADEQEVLPSDVEAQDVEEVWEEPGIGGSEQPTDEPAMEQPSMGEQALEEPAVEEVPITETPPPAISAEPVESLSTTDVSDERREKFTDRLRFTVGGGVEGYTGTLNSRVNAGPTWGVTVGTQPVAGIGAELAYSGAVNEVNGDIATAPDHLTNGADILRNGGHAAVTLNAPTPYVQPYVVAGIGYDYYNVRGGDNVVFNDDGAGRVPLGLGIRGRAGAFSMDLRGQFNALFDQEFAEVAGDGQSGGYTTMLQVGARF